jgi:hypothetical protein
MARGSSRRPAHGSSPSGAELRILRFIQLGELHRPATVPRPEFTIGRLSGLLELEHAACCRALYLLVRRADLSVEILAGGRFRLIPASPAQPSGRAATPDDE